MHSTVLLKLADTLRRELDEFAERWVTFIKVNDLVSLGDEPEDEAINRTRLGLEVLANLLEGKEFSSIENVVRRLLHDWVNSAASFDDLIRLEEGFHDFILPLLEIDPESDETDEFLRQLSAFFHSDIRTYFLTLYLQVYEEIINAESNHTAYVLEHFDAVLDLTAHLNGAATRNEILHGLPTVVRGLFENVIAVVLWDETPDRLDLRSVELLGDEVPLAVISREVPEKIAELFKLGQPRWIPEDWLGVDIKTLLGVEIQSVISGCVIPIRPRESDGIMILLVTGSDNPGTLEMSLSRVAAAECALALDRVAGSERIEKMNNAIRDILSLSRESAWGSSFRDATELVIEYLSDLTSCDRAILLGPSPGAGAGKRPVSLAWKNLTAQEVDSFRDADSLSPIISVTLKSGKGLLLEASRLQDILAGREPPMGFSPSSDQALGILPLINHENRQGICLFVCSAEFAGRPESSDILAIFAKTAADSLASTRDYERSLKIESIVQADSERARLLQQRLTSRYLRSGSLVYWAHLQPAGELAGDVLLARTPLEGSMNIWAADIAGRGHAVAWSMMFVRQLLSEIPYDIQNPEDALREINSKLHEIDSFSTPGIFTTLVGIVLDQSTGKGSFARAGAPRMWRISANGTRDLIDPDGIPLGLFADAMIEESSFSFDPGDCIVWASDGLLGIRNEHGKVWGEAGLLKCLDKSPHLPARALYENILTAAGLFAAEDQARDDWSVIVCGNDPEPDWEGVMSGRERQILTSNALKWLVERCSNERDCVAMRILLDEAIDNAFEHGNGTDEDARIWVLINICPNHVYIRVRDEGGRLNEKVTIGHIKPDKILEEKGRGFLLIRHQCDLLWVDENLGELNIIKNLEVRT